MDFSSRPAVSPSDNHGVGAGADERGDRPSSSTSSEKWEHMFEKVVTPSDVGKLNRLVIPKQHAEKYFPLDSSGSDKGLLLDFEDRDGKSWRFRYSYWTSSQSYVITKGWTRFVKAKRLHAGDLVSFHRHGRRPTTFFIDWRRRPPPPPLPPYSHIQYGLPLLHHHRSPPQQQQHRGSLVTGLLGTATAAPSATNEPISRHQIYIRGQHQMQIQMQLAAPSSSVTVAPSAAAGKRLRLFGVNMDCSEDHDSEASADAAAANDVNINSTEEDEGSLELRLDGSAPVLTTPSSSSSMHTTTMTTTSNFLEKGKSSMTLDFDF